MKKQMEKPIKTIIIGAFSALTAWLGVLAIPEIDRYDKSMYAPAEELDNANAADV